MDWRYFKYILFVYAWFMMLGLFFPHGEWVYPFFSWSLFSQVGANRYEYVLQIADDGDEADCPFLKNQRGRGSRFRKLMKNFGYAVERDRRERAVILRRQLENHLADCEVKSYQLVKVRFNTFTRYRHQQIETEEVLKEFIYGQ